MTNNPRILDAACSKGKAMPEPRPAPEPIGPPVLTTADGYVLEFRESKATLISEPLDLWSIDLEPWEI